MSAPLSKNFEAPAYPDNSLFFPMTYGLPYQTFPYDFVGNRGESAPSPKEAVMESAFSMFV